MIQISLKHDIVSLFLNTYWNTGSIFLYICSSKKMQLNKSNKYLLPIAMEHQSQNIQKH